MQMGAARFVAGSTLPTALERVRDINSRGIMATMDHLGESVGDVTEAVDAKDSYLAMLDGIRQSGVQSTVSLKLTMMGLALDEELARRNLREIVAKAAEFQNYVRIDMENTPYTDATIRLFQEAHQIFPQNVGLVLQAYLYRTLDDLRNLSGSTANLRIVKGAYQEPVAMAFPSKPDVDENYVKLVQESLNLGNYTAIATHDERIIGQVLKFVHERNVPRERFEFQMLYGVGFSVLESLAHEGYRTRVYVPYGEDWYAYYVRRVAERPANLLFFARALFGRK